MNTCQNAAYTTSNNVDCNPNPNTSTANGINATDGTGRRNSTVDAVTRRNTSTLPNSMPTAIPATSAMTRPSPQPVTVSRTAVQNAAVCASSPNADTIRENGGK